PLIRSPVTASRLPLETRDLTPLWTEPAPCGILASARKPGSGVARRPRWPVLGLTPPLARTATARRRSTVPFGQMKGSDPGFGSRRLVRMLPAARPALVRAGEERARGAGEDLQVEPRAAVFDVPEVELDSLVPRELRPAVDLRPAGQARPDLQAPALPRRVLVDLVAERRARADQAH